MENSPNHLSLAYWRSYRLILYCFMIYGIVGGIVFYAASTNSQLSTIAILINVPAINIVLALDFAVFNPFSLTMLLDPLLLIPYLTIVWTLIGLGVFAIVRMLRLGS